MTCKATKASRKQWRRIRGEERQSKKRAVLVSDMWRDGGHVKWKAPNAIQIYLVLTGTLDILEPGSLT